MTRSLAERWRDGGGKPDISPDQLAQARGCEPDNECYADCAQNAREALDGWDDLDDWTRNDILGLVPWIRE